MSQPAPHADDTKKGPVCAECGQRFVIFTKINEKVFCAHCVAKALL